MICEDEWNRDLTLPVQQAAVLNCERIPETITENQFNIQVLGIDLQPYFFAG